MLNIICCVGFIGSIPGFFFCLLTNDNNETTEYILMKFQCVIELDHLYNISKFNLVVRLLDFGKNPGIKPVGKIPLLMNMTDILK